MAVPFAAIVLAMLPAVLDQTILATALPVVAAELGAITDVSWVVTAYVVSAAATTPLWGTLGDRHGRKLLLQVALAVFVLSSALCGVAQDITQLVVLRVVQGAAAGGLMTLAMGVVGDLVAPRERGRYQGYIATASRSPRSSGRCSAGWWSSRRAGAGCSSSTFRSASPRSPCSACGCSDPRLTIPAGRSTPPARRCWRARPPP